MSLALRLKEEGLTQQEIADVLGVAQAAISKYFNGKCSRSIKEMSGAISRKGLLDSLVEKAKEGRKEEVEKGIDELCEKIVASTNFGNAG